MADITVTAANVVADAGASIRSGTAGAAITAGQAVYVHTDGTIRLARANAEATASLAGVALNDAAVGQPVSYIMRGTYTAGATVAAGTVYVLSAAAAGGIAPEADLVNPNRVSLLGVGISATKIMVSRINTGVAHA
jgi:hypothetical protein